MARAVWSMKSLAPITDRFPVGSECWYILNPLRRGEGNRYLRVRVTGVTHKRVVVRAVDGQGGYRSVLPWSLTIEAPPAGTEIV